MKTKIKSHGDEVTDVYNKKFLKVNSSHTCLAVISLHSVLKKDDNYCLQVFLKGCKYIEEKVIRHINNNLSDFSSDDDESDEELIKVIMVNVFLKQQFLNVFFWVSNFEIVQLRITFLFNAHCITFFKAFSIKAF